MIATGAALHLPTLLIVSGILSAFSGALLMSARRGRSQTEAARIWGGSMLVASGGWFMGASRQDPTSFGNGVETTLFLAALGLSWIGADRFAGRRARMGLAIAGPLFWLVTLPWHAGSQFWVAIASAIGIFYTLGVAFAFWDTRGEDLPSRIPAVMLQVLHAMVFLIRAIVAVFDMRPRGAGGSVASALVLESLLYTVGIAFLLLAMMKERAELTSNRKLRALTLRDELTGVGNRRHFDEQLATEVRLVRRGSMPLSMLMIDVDHFKAFNDAAGHPAGDVCLRTVAQTISSVLTRPRDLVARYGGEEFAVLMPDTNSSGATHVGEAIRAAIEDLGMANPGVGGVLTISVGVGTLYRDGKGTGASLVRAADAALYVAKSAGRNRVSNAPGTESLPPVGAATPVRNAG